jgi:hypothetical protein
MSTLIRKSEMKRMFNLLSFLFWPFSPKKLQPIKVVAPAATKKR